MKAVILCAGYATRLYPITINEPKALMKIAGQPLLSYTINNIKNIKEIDKIYVVTNSKFYDKFLKWKKDMGKVEIIDDGTFKNEERLGGVMDFNIAFKKCINDDIFIILGDNLFNLDLEGFVNFFNRNRRCCVALHDVKNLEESKRFGVIELDSNSKIIGFEEKPQEPKSTLISTGAYIFPKEFTGKMQEYIASDKNKDGIGYMIQDFIKSDFEIDGFVFDESWVDIGTIEDYKKINKEMIKWKFGKK